MKIDTYTIKGTKSTAVNAPRQFNTKDNPALLAQAIRVYRNALGVPAKTKTRAEIVASKRKIYRQKGTGRARHGALSAPIFVGGGKAHGPKGVKRRLTLSKAMRVRALALALSEKTRDGKVVVVTDLAKINKTKHAQEFLNKVSGKVLGKMSNKFTICLAVENKDISRFFKNIPNVKTILYKDLNAYDVYLGGLLVIDKQAFGKTSAGTKK